MPDPGPPIPPGPAAPPDHASLTGTWMANDGGMYFLRQVGDILWWLGASGGLMHPGLEFCNVFHGSVTGSAVTGDWSCVPRGAASGRGTLTLRPAGGHQLLRVGGSGGFGASVWRRTSNSAWPVIATGQAFAATLRNVLADGDSYAKATLASALQPLKDSVSVFAVVARSGDDRAPPVTAFGLGRTELAGREVPILATGSFRLMKLYDA